VTRYRCGPIREPGRAHVTAKWVGFGTQKILSGRSAELGGEVLIGHMPRYSQAQFGLRTQITGVLHDASPDRVCKLCFDLDEQAGAQCFEHYRGLVKETPVDISTLGLSFKPTARGLFGS
jgi:hypothetical protein